MQLNYWDEIDSFLYYDFWHRSGHETSKKIRSENLNSFIKKLQSENIKFFLHRSTIFNILENIEYDLKAYSECLIIEKKNTQLLLSILKNSDFQIVYFDNNNLKIIRKNRLLEIYLKSEPKLFNKVSELTLFENRVSIYKKEIILFKLISRPKKLLNRILSKLKVVKLNIYKSKETFIFKKHFKAKNLKLNEIHKLNLQSFLNLKIESKYSASWIVRKKHLDIVTSNKKHLVVKDIIKFLKKDNNLDKLVKNVDESRIEKEILGSVSHSKYFWNAGNNYFLFSSYFEFRKNIVPYKKVNDYINSDNNELIYTKKYYEKLELMDEFEIKEFLDKNPIEITNNCITSGKHRAFAMIGRLVRDKEYISFSAKINNF